MYHSFIYFQFFYGNFCIAGLIGQSRLQYNYIFSANTPLILPPTHSVTIPHFALRFFIIMNNPMIIRAQGYPTVCPGVTP